MLTPVFLGLVRLASGTGGVCFAAEANDLATLRAEQTLLEKQGDALFNEGKIGEALVLREQNLALGKKVLSLDPGNTEALLHLAMAHSRLAEEMVAQRRFSEVFDAAKEAAALLDQVDKKDAESIPCRHVHALINERLGDAYRGQGELTAALKVFQENAKIHAALVKEEPTNIKWRVNETISAGRIGDIYRALGEPGEALKEYQFEMSLTEGIIKDYPTDSKARHELARVCEKVALLLQDKDDLEGALRYSRKSVATEQKLSEENPGNPYWQQGLAVSLYRTGESLRLQQHYEEARQVYARSLAILDTLTKEHPETAAYRVNLADTCERLAYMMANLRRENLDEQLALVNRGIATMDSLHEEEIPPDHRIEIRRSMVELRDWINATLAARK